MEALSPPGRLLRVIATTTAAGLLLAGTVWGEDDHFPFGPFRMYASAVDPDAPAADTRLEATDADGRTVLLTALNTGIRRAEIEGQLPRLQQEPALLQLLIGAYERRNPSAPRLTEVRVIIRWHEVRGFQPTGRWTEDVVATWEP
jgi:hypothetical protein